MKKKFTLICLVFSIIGLFVFTARAQKFPQADLIVKTVANGTPYTTVIKKLGKPQSETADAEIDQCIGGRGKTLSYDGLEIYLMGDENGEKLTVLSMKITSSKWLTSKGVKIGDNYKTVLAKYGKTEYEAAYERPAEEKVLTGEKWLSYEMKTNGPGGTVFYFKNDRLVRMEIKPTTC